MESIPAPDVASIVRFLAVTGCGLLAGVFFAFSTFMMKSLSRIPAEQGIAAMQSISGITPGTSLKSCFSMS